jgi:hypothetical protein
MILWLVGSSLAAAVIEEVFDGGAEMGEERGLGGGFWGGGSGHWRCKQSVVGFELD